MKMHKANYNCCRPFGGLAAVSFFYRRWPEATEAEATEFCNSFSIFHLFFILALFKFFLFCFVLFYHRYYYVYGWQTFNSLSERNECL